MRKNSLNKIFSENDFLKEKRLVWLDMSEPTPQEAAAGSAPEAAEDEAKKGTKDKLNEVKKDVIESQGAEKKDELKEELDKAIAKQVGDSAEAFRKNLDARIKNDGVKKTAETLNAMVNSWDHTSAANLAKIQTDMQSLGYDVTLPLYATMFSYLSRAYDAGTPEETRALYQKPNEGDNLKKIEENGDNAFVKNWNLYQAIRTQISTVASILMDAANGENPAVAPVAAPVAVAETSGVSLTAREHAKKLREEREHIPVVSSVLEGGKAYLNKTITAFQKGDLATGLTLAIGAGLALYIGGRLIKSLHSTNGGKILIWGTVAAIVGHAAAKKFGFNVLKASGLQDNAEEAVDTHMEPLLDIVPRSKEIDGEVLLQSGAINMGDLMEEYMSATDRAANGGLRAIDPAKFTIGDLVFPEYRGLSLDQNYYNNDRYARAADNLYLVGDVLKESYEKTLMQNQSSEFYGKDLKEAIKIMKAKHMKVADFCALLKPYQKHDIESAGKRATRKTGQAAGDAVSWVGSGVKKVGDVVGGAFDTAGDYTRRGGKKIKDISSQNS